MQTVEMTDGLLTPKDVGAKLKKSADWVRKRAADGTLPHRKVGRDLRFEPGAIEAWLKKQPGGD